MNKTLSFISVKGGVGKTMLALETAVTLANHFNKKILLVDANFSAPNIALYLDLTHDFTLHDVLTGTPLHNAIYESHGVDIIPASMYYKDEIDPTKLKKILEKFKLRYDFIIIDSSPNSEEIPPVITASDSIFIITTPDHVTLETSMKAAKLAKQQKTPVQGLIVNRIRSPRHEYNLEEIEEISEIPVLAKIKDSKEIIAAMKNKKPITIYSPQNPVSQEIKRFSAALCGQEEQKPSFFQKLMQKITTIVPKEKVNRDLYRQKFYEPQIK